MDRSAGESEALWDWNLVTNRIHFSPRWLALVGCQDDVLGNTPDEWFRRVHPDDLDQVLRHVEDARAAASSEFNFDHRLCHTSGKYRWMSCRGAVERTGDGHAIRMIGRHAEITIGTVTDPVTGLPNRQLFLDRLTQSIDRANRQPGFCFAVLLVELGRPAGSATVPDAGDPLLAAAARRLETCLRSADSTPRWRDDDLVARLHGDQFAVLLDGLKDVARVQALGDRILSEVLTPFVVGGRDVFLSASVGIAVSPTGYRQPGDVVRDAETALHRARILGASRCAVFDTAVVQSEHAELELQGDMGGALERGEFELVYQPIVAVASDRIVGFEALVRWQHPRLGELSPLDFIPIAERGGFIVPLGAWILRSACQQLRSWRETLPCATDLWMSVNLSTVQMRHAGLIEQVRGALKDSALEAKSLVLELTEGIAMENPIAVRTVLMQLRAMGVRISIDDFGTGYSSLAYLSQLPVDALKIDKSFIRGIETHQDKADIVATLTTMAQQLKLHVVAEGIENEEHLSYLRTLHCESAQGFLFAKPVDVETATELLKTGLPQRPASTPDDSTSVYKGAHLSGHRRRTAVVSWRTVAAGLALLMVCIVIVWLGNSGPPTVQTEVQLLTSGTAVARGGLHATGDASTDGASTSPSQATTEEQTSIRVTHLHRLGTCDGRLVISRKGVAFTPSAKDSHDPLNFRYSEFLYSMTDDTLTIKSHSGDYRFRMSQAGSKKAGSMQLRDAVKTIAQYAAP